MISDILYLLNFRKKHSITLVDAGAQDFAQKLIWKQIKFCVKYDKNNDVVFESRGRDFLLFRDRNLMAYLEYTPAVQEANQKENKKLYGKNYDK